MQLCILAAFEYCLIYFSAWRLFHPHTLSKVVRDFTIFSLVTFASGMSERFWVSIKFLVELLIFLQELGLVRFWWIPGCSRVSRVSPSLHQILLSDSIPSILRASARPKWWPFSLGVRFPSFCRLISLSIHPSNTLTRHGGILLRQLREFLLQSSGGEILLSPMYVPHNLERFGLLAIRLKIGRVNIRSIVILLPFHYDKCLEYFTNIQYNIKTIQMFIFPSISILYNTFINWNIIIVYLL